MTTHSLTFQDSKELDTLKELMKTKKFGTEIKVPEPLAVNMTVKESLDEKPISAKRQRVLDTFKKLSIIVDGTIVIQITRSNQNDQKNHNNKNIHSCRTNSLQQFAKAQTFETFPLTLHFQ